MNAPLYLHLLDILAEPASEHLILAGGFGIRLKQDYIRHHVLPRGERTLIPEVPVCSQAGGSRHRLRHVFIGRRIYSSDMSRNDLGFLWLSDPGLVAVTEDLRNNGRSLEFYQTQKNRIAEYLVPDPRGSSATSTVYKSAEEYRRKKGVGLDDPFLGCIAAATDEKFVEVLDI